MVDEPPASYPRLPAQLAAEVYGFPECSYGAARATLVLSNGRVIYDVILGGEDRLSKTVVGDGLKFWRQESEEEGQKIHVYTWEIAHCAPPEKLCIAIFTWTLLAPQSAEQKFQKEIEVLDHEIAKAYFHPEIGSV